MPVYTSANDISIDAWEGTYRTMVLGAERFVTGLGVMPSGISVSSPVGLRSVSIFNGDRLFRRFAPNGSTHFFTTLLLDGFIHRNLVLVAEDIEGYKAMSFPRRNWKGGVRSVEYVLKFVYEPVMIFICAAVAVDTNGDECCKGSDRSVLQPQV